MQTITSMNVQRRTSYDDWVWVKDKAFCVNENSNVSTFMVEWNDTDCMFAVTSRFGTRIARDTEDKSKTGAFCVSALHGIGETLHGLNSSVPKMPSNLLPKEPKGLKAVFEGLQMPQDTTDLCRDLENYFTTAAEKLGMQVLHEVMFEATSNKVDNYYEQMSEVYRHDLSQKIVFVEDELKNIAFERENCAVMKDLEDVYSREDETVMKLISALADYYNYELQPYLDSHCLAMKKIEYYSKQIKSPDLGERIKNESKEQHLFWGCLLIEAKEIIQKLNVEHQAEIVSIFQELIEQMKIDKNRFGAGAFDLVAAERELNLYKELHAAKVQLLQSKRNQLKQDKDKISMQIPEGNSALESTSAKQLLIKKDKIQEKIYSVELDILTEKLNLADAKIELRKREMSDAEDENLMFYDAVEDVKELSDDEDANAPSGDEELAKLKQEKVKVSQYRSKIRAKKELFLGSVRSKYIQSEESELKNLRRHQIQKKRDQQKEEERERSNFIFEERKKTIERLKEYKMKYTSPATIKPQRYQKPKQKHQQTVTKTKTSPGSLIPVDGKKISCLDKSKDASKSSAQPQKSICKTPSDNLLSVPAAGESSNEATARNSDMGVNNSSSTSEHPLSSLQPLAESPPPPPPLPPPPPPPAPPLLSPQSEPLPSSAISMLKSIGSINDVKDSLKGLKKVGINKDCSAQPSHINLDSILASRSRLKPASERQERPTLVQDTDPLAAIFSMIRSGVTLKKVEGELNGDRHNDLGNTSTHSVFGSDARSQLHNTLLNKIGHGVRGSSPESDNDYDSDDDEFDD